MSVSRVHTWIAGEVLTASDLNAEFNNIVNAGISLISPLSTTLNFNGNQATNLRLETQSATQSAGAEGLVYWHTGEDCLHISTGSAQARVPALTGIQASELVGTSPTAVEGATSYARIQLAATAFHYVGSTLHPTFPAATTAATGLATNRGLSGTVTTTTIVLTADEILLANSSGEVVKHSTGSLTVDSAVAGLNGRDQSGAFSSSQDLYVYWISDGTNLRGVLSDAPPATGPDLTTLGDFSGYTYWAYIAALIWNSSSNFIPARIRGNWVFYETQQNVLTNGTATIETSITISGFVPVQARSFQLIIDSEQPNSVTIRVVSGSNFGSWDSTNIQPTTILVPNISQTLFYLRGGATQTDMEISGYTVSNGDS